MKKIFGSPMASLVALAFCLLSIGWTLTIASQYLTSTVPTISVVTADLVNHER